MEQNLPLVVNYFAGPGTGKSSTMAHTFAELKWNGINAEQAPEYAKGKVWEGSFNILRNQIYIFGKQHHTVHRLQEGTECVVTDSPLLLSLIYGDHMSSKFHDFVLEQYHSFRNVNFFLTRTKPYNPKGRVQNYEEALEKDQQVLSMLKRHDIPFETIPACRESVPVLVDKLMKLLRP